MDLSEASVPSPARVFQVCLAGPTITEDLPLARLLKPRHLVTLAGELDHLLETSLLQTVDVLVLECTRDVDKAMGLVARLKEQAPRLVVVLVNGGLSQIQLAGAFRDGIKDYFPADYTPELLAERVAILAATPRRQEMLEETDATPT